MKKILTILLIVVSEQLFAQSTISSINISMPGNLDANTANWGTGVSMLTITAMTKSANGRINPAVEESKILLTIKKGGTKICGTYTSNSAPASNFNSTTKVWSGKNASGLFGQDCILKPGNYELCVQFFGNGPAGIISLSEEKSKAFIIKGDEQKSLINPNIPNANTGKPGIQPNTRVVIFGDTTSDVKVGRGGTNNNSKSKTITRTWIADDTSSTKVDNKLKIEDENKTKQSSVACDCNKDMYVIAQVNSTGYKIRCRETKLFDLGTTIHFIPQNICNPANCLTDWNMAVNDAQTGAFITSGTVTSYTSSIALTLNSVNGYKITWAGHCNGKKCECTFWIKKK